MAEIRKHNPTTSDIGEQVRALLGETIRPVTPGEQPGQTSGRAAPAHQPSDDMFDPFDRADTDPSGTADATGTADENAADETGDNIVSIMAGGDPLIGVLPADFNPWFFDDEPPAAA